TPVRGGAATAPPRTVSAAGELAGFAVGAEARADRAQDERLGGSDRVLEGGVVGAGHAAAADARRDHGHGGIQVVGLEVAGIAPGADYGSQPVFQRADVGHHLFGGV